MECERRKTKATRRGTHVVRLAARVTVFAALFIGAGQGCNGDGARDAQPSTNMLAKATPVRKLNLSDGPGAHLGKYKMHWPKRTQEEVAARMTKVATVMRGRPVRFTGNWRMQNLPERPFDDQNLTVTYDAPHDDLSLMDEILWVFAESCG